MRFEACIRKYAQKAKNHPRFIPRADEEEGFLFKESDFFADNESIHISLHPTTPFPQSKKVLHSHDFFVLTYVYRGRFRQLFSEEELVQNEGEISLLSMGVQHYVENAEKGSVVFNILLRKTMVEKTFLHLLSTTPLMFHFFLDSLYGIHNNKRYLLFRANKDARLYLRQIIVEYIDQREFYEEMVFANLLRLFFELARQHKEPAPDPAQNRSQYEMIEYVKKNYATVTLGQVAEAFNYSNRQAMRLIKSATGKHFTDIVAELKINNACMYLEKTDLDINHIIDLVGYSSADYFYKVFRKYTGMSYTEYKKKRTQLDAKP